MNSDGSVIDVVPRADRADIELRAVEDPRRDLHREPRVAWKFAREVQPGNLHINWVIFHLAT